MQKFLFFWTLPCYKEEDSIFREMSLTLKKDWTGLTIDLTEDLTEEHTHKAIAMKIAFHYLFAVTVLTLYGGQV